MHLVSGFHWFVAFVQDHRFIGYAILFAGMIFEGETFLLGSGVLLHLGAFDPLDTFAIAFVGVTLGDFLWYYLGVFLHARYADNKIVAYTRENILRLLPNFSTKPFWSIFVSKFIYGLNHSALVFSGFIRIKLKTFAEAEIPASISWITLNLAIGYLISYTAINITHDLRVFGLIIIAIVALFLGLKRFITYIARAQA